MPVAIIMNELEKHSLCNKHVYYLSTDAIFIYCAFMWKNNPIALDSMQIVQRRLTTQLNISLFMTDFTF